MTTDDAYNKECRKFVEDVRNLLGAGYGEGHQTKDFLRIIAATRSYMLYLEQRFTQPEEMLRKLKNYLSIHHFASARKEVAEMCAEADEALKVISELAPPKAYRFIPKWTNAEQRKDPSSWSVRISEPPKDWHNDYVIEELR